MAGPACAGPFGHIELSSTSVDDPEMQLGEVSFYEHIQYRALRVMLQVVITVPSHQLSARIALKVRQSPRWQGVEWVIKEAIE